MKSIAAALIALIASAHAANACICANIPDINAKNIAEGTIVYRQEYVWGLPVPSAILSAVFGIPNGRAYATAVVRVDKVIRGHSPSYILLTGKISNGADCAGRLPHGHVLVMSDRRLGIQGLMGVCQGVLAGTYEDEQARREAMKF